MTWNVEYRRLGLGGGYPATLQDAAAAIDHLATLSDVDTERVVAVGHSAGGHLATWAAGQTKLAAGAPGAEPVVEITGVVSLAGALCQVPIPAAVRCVHARADDRVPFAQSVTYVAAARAAGQDARLLEVDGDHFSVADASAPTWPVVIKAIEELLGAV